MIYSEHIEKENKVKVRMHYSDLMQQFHEYKPVNKNDNNGSRITKFQSKTFGGNFEGGTTRDFLNLPDMEPFIEAKRKILESRLDQKISNAVGYKPKRKRTNDEYDGDWSYDKKWDVKAFNRAYKLPTPNRFVTIRADFSINAGTSADAINEYGSIVWALCQILEELGINTEIQFVNECWRMYKPKRGDKLVDAEYTVDIKKSTEYLSPQALASVFRSVFFRIGMFNTFCIEGDKHGLQAESGLGQPKNATYGVKFENDILYVAADVNPKSGEIEKAIVEIVNGKI